MSDYRHFRGPAAAPGDRIFWLVGVAAAKIRLAEAWSTQYGWAGVLFSRLLPVIRHLIGIPAGILRLDFRWYSVATLAGSAAQIKAQLTQQQQAQQVPVFLQQLRAKANITVYDDRYKDAFPPPLPAPATSAAPAPAAT